jgi:hypothetical protein
MTKKSKFVDVVAQPFPDWPRKEYRFRVGPHGEIHVENRLRGCFTRALLSTVDRMIVENEARTVPST